MKKDVQEIEAALDVITSSGFYYGPAGRIRIVIDGWVQQAEALEHRLALAEARIAAFIENIGEMSFGVGLPECFPVIGPDGKTHTVPPESAKSFYDAIYLKWQGDQDALMQLLPDERRDNARLRAVLCNLRYFACGACAENQKTVHAVLHPEEEVPT